MFNLKPGTITSGPVIQGNFRYYGVYLTPNGEWACRRCHTVNPDLVLIKEESGRNTHQCKCRQRVIVEKVQ